MKLAFIINPAAGGGRRAWSNDALDGVFRPLGVEASTHVTRAPGDARGLARKLAPVVDLICIVGGDGTVHETVNGIMPGRVPVAVIPAGSGNDLASLVDCPRTPEALARVIENGWAARLDVIDFGDRYCVNSAGLGFEGLVNRHSHAFAPVGGRARYVLALAKALGELRCPDFTIVTSRGDEITGKKLLVSIGNGHRTGGAFRLTPDALPDDGLIDVCIVEPLSRARMLWILPRTISGGHVNRSEVRMLRVESLTIESPEAYPMHIDGEYFTAGPERRQIAVRPAALTVLCRPSPRNKLSRDLIRVTW